LTFTSLCDTGYHVAKFTQSVPSDEAWARARIGHYFDFYDSERLHNGQKAE
jgi:hypothetical protein